MIREIVALLIGTVVLAVIVTGGATDGSGSDENCQTGVGITYGSYQICVQIDGASTTVDVSGDQDVGIEDGDDAIAYAVGGDGKDGESDGNDGNNVSVSVQGADGDSS